MPNSKLTHLRPRLDLLIRVAQDAGHSGAQAPHIERGSPIESDCRAGYDSKLREEFLNGEIFNSMKEPSARAERWKIHNNTVRPNSSLGCKPLAPDAWLTKVSQGMDEREAKESFRHVHDSNCGDELNLLAAPR